MSTAPKKRCYHCGTELKEHVNPAEERGGFYGVCEACSAFKAESFAVLKKRLCSRPAEPEKTP